MRHFIHANQVWIVPLITSGVMTCLVSAIATLRAVEPNSFFGVWPLSWLISWLVAFPTMRIALPVVTRFVERLGSVRK